MYRHATTLGIHNRSAFQRKTKKPAIMAVEAYCVKCKAKREMKDPKENTMANGRKAMKGTCTKCGTGMFKILGK